MANTDQYSSFEFEPWRNTVEYIPRGTWPVQASDLISLQGARMATQIQRSTSPNPQSNQSHAYQHQQVAHQSAPALMRNWQASAQELSNSAYALNTQFLDSSYETFGASYQTSPTNYMPTNTQFDTGMGSSLDASLITMEGSYLAIPSQLTQNHNLQQIGPMSGNFLDFSTAGFGGIGSATGPTLPEMMLDLNVPQSVPESSYSDSYLEEVGLDVRSLSSSEAGWASINHTSPPFGAITNPAQALHPRTYSDSSSEYEQVPANSWSTGGYIDVQLQAMSSPETESTGDMEFNNDQYPYQEFEQRSPPITTAQVQPIAIRQSTAPQQRPSVSPVVGKKARKSPLAKPTKTLVKVPAQNGKTDADKKVGKRKGPLSADRRKQAGEIRKLGACLRCRYLKKTCDKGEPCIGCQPSHARLWQVPCTRIDIKDIAYFMKDWKVDYERHISLQISVANIKGFSDQEMVLHITHGFGFAFPVRAREVYVRDEKCFGVEWVDTTTTIKPTEYIVDTARLTSGKEGIPSTVISEYLDCHIDGGFEQFVEDFFSGTPFISQLLKTAFRFWQRERTPIIRKALKFVLAYSLTQHVTLIEQIPGQPELAGRITDENSYWYGRTMAPMMINFEIKYAMANMWRELQKDILEELSALYSSVYTNKDKLKHWPTIFILAAIILTVWEQMQFDCRYKVPDAGYVEKFCNDMSGTPVGVMVGLFSTISQKLPAFSDWDSRKHSVVLGDNQSVCKAMQEVKEHVTSHDKYLRERSQAQFDREDFDSLANIFVSKLVIRAN